MFNFKILMKNFPVHFFYFLFKFKLKKINGFHTTVVLALVWGLSFERRVCKDDCGLDFFKRATFAALRGADLGRSK